MVIRAKAPDAGARKRMQNIWRGMIGRCHNVGHISYPRYGAKGIAVCDRWRHSFDSFLSDIGFIPSGMSLDRIDNRIGYQPDNVRIATLIEQANNKSSVKLYEYKGRSMSLGAWAREIGIPKERLHYRIKAGWPIELALTTKALSPHVCGMIRQQKVRI